MKLKQQPEDFRVEEVSRLEPGADGVFALYRLEKRGLATPEAVRLFARAWRLPPQDVAFAGLKDRYGVTGQTVSVRRGPGRNFEGRGLKLNYLGRSDRPAGRGTILANRFRLVVRDLQPGQAERVVERAQAAAEHGIPDYYDDQRFGSVRGTDGAFVARALLEGDDEEALRLAVASPARADRSRLKRRRKLLKKRWGDWAALASEFEPSLERDICALLARGGTFEAAYGMVDRSVRGLHLAALQAHLFNAGLRRVVPDGGPEHAGLAGPYRFYEGPPPDALAGERIPLASATAGPHPLLDAALAADGLDRTMFLGFPFRSGARGTVIRPGNLACGDPEPDALNPGRACVSLGFVLRPGSYATMLVKRCTYDM